MEFFFSLIMDSDSKSCRMAEKITKKSRTKVPIRIIYFLYIEIWYVCISSFLSQLSATENERNDFSLIFVLIFFPPQIFPSLSWQISFIWWCATFISLRYNILLCWCLCLTLWLGAMNQMVDTHANKMKIYVYVF